MVYCWIIYNITSLKKKSFWDTSCKLTLRTSPIKRNYEPEELKGASFDLLNIVIYFGIVVIIVARVAHYCYYLFSVARSNHVCVYKKAPESTRKSRNSALLHNTLDPFLPFILGEM